MSQNRSAFWDTVRGFLIVMVVVGHVIQYVILPNSFDNNIVFRVIYSFHMPLFMLVSGYVGAFGHQKFTSDYIKKRVLSLLVPFLVWSLADSLIRYRKTFFSTFLKKIIYPENGLWFLWALAFIILLVYISELINNKLENTKIPWGGI